MGLTESIDRYLAAVHRIAGGRVELEGESDPFWSPARQTFEEVIGFEVPDEVWELWSHDLLRNHRMLAPSGMCFRGPQRLFSDQFQTYSVLHFGIEQQIPILRYPSEERLSLVAEVGAWPEIWLGGWFDGQEQCHRFKMSLVELFDRFADGIDDGYLIWSPTGGVGASDEFIRLDRDYDPDDPIAVLWYAVAPRQVDRAEAIADGAIMDEDHDLDGFMLEVTALARERRERWETLVGPFPADVLNDRFD